MGGIVVFGVVTASIGLLVYISSICQCWKRNQEFVGEVVELKELAKDLIKDCNVGDEAVGRDNTGEVSKMHLLKKLSAIRTSANREWHDLDRLEQSRRINRFVQLALLRELPTEVIRRRLQQQREGFHSAVQVFNLCTSSETLRSIEASSKHLQRLDNGIRGSRDEVQPCDGVQGRRQVLRQQHSDQDPSPN